MGAGAHDTLDAPLTQAQLFVSARPRGRWGAALSLGAIGDTLPISRQNLLPSRTTERALEQRETRLWTAFGDVAAYTDRAGELHVKPMVLSLDTAMTKLKTGASPAGAPASRSEEYEDELQQTRGLSVAHRAASVSGLLWDTQGGWYRSTEDKDKRTQAFKTAAGALVPDKGSVEDETKADRTWNLAASLAWPAGGSRRHDMKAGVSRRRRRACSST